MRRSRRVILALALAGPLVCLCLAALFFRFTAGQLRRLLHAARRIREGDLDHRVPPLRDEFGELAGAFNDMAAALEEQIQKARRAQQLAVCGEMATRLAHEIKNPLAGIRASMEVLAEDPDIPPADRPILERVLAEVERVHRLTRNLLDFARPPAPSPAPFQLPEIVEQALTFACREPGGGEVRVERRYDEDLPEVTADPAQVQQVFLNLFLNAVEAMPAGGTLQVRLRAVDGGARVAAEVSDTGGGVPPGELHRIFEPFFTTKHKGTGLGLTITHNLVTANGGDIQARANPGGGMTFAVILPARRKDPP
nr:HAMP domain-containing sensor histidine kinase [Dissulfurirhabdus thermomarina]